ncbi:MAG TPA: Xaa-Pro peptidase family protein [Thermomicrobiales bacterium]|nr:Xaa-Pro peptidase family protein [Thermomicrobiales bacterium]
MTNSATAGTPIIDQHRYLQRLDRVREQLRANGVDVLLLGPSADLYYLTGFDAHLSERLNLLVVPVEGSPSLVVPVLEAPLIGDARSLVEVHTWVDHEDPQALAAKVIGPLNGKQVAVGNQLWSAFLLRLQQRVPNGSWREASPLMRPLRMVKDEAEIALMAEVSRLTDEAWEEFIGGPPLSGLTEREALRRLVDLTAARGLSDIWGICASGPNAASPHHATGSRTIRDGDAVLFDWGGKREGYQSDVTRTIAIGDPGEEFRHVYDVVLRANQATLDAVLPGVPLQDLDRTARRLISEAGYGEAFIHRVGHGLGLEVHEEPYLVEGNDLPLEAGMVFSDEPGVYLEGRFGIRIEDTVVCTGDGGMRLNHARRELTTMQ